MLRQAQHRRLHSATSGAKTQSTESTKIKSFVPSCLRAFVVKTSDTLLETKIEDGFDGKFLLGAGQAVVEGQAH
jgi:hypothetical protein